MNEVGMTPEAARKFKQMVLLTAVSITISVVVSTAVASYVIMDRTVARVQETEARKRFTDRLKHQETLLALQRCQLRGN